MGEIADDHFVSLSWSHGTGVGGNVGTNDGYPAGPPCDHPAFGGMDAFIARRTQRSANTYRCKFCRSLIGFLNRQPYNLVDGTPHRCLADARALAQKNNLPLRDGGE